MRMGGTSGGTIGGSTASGRSTGGNGLHPPCALAALLAKPVGEPADSIGDANGGGLGVKRNRLPEFVCNNAGVQSMFRSSGGPGFEDSTVAYSTHSRPSSASLLLDALPQDHFPVTEATSDLVEITDRRGNVWLKSKRCIGKGTFGAVFVGLQQDGSLCAIKLISIPDLMERAALSSNLSVLSPAESINIDRSMRSDLIPSFDPGNAPPPTTPAEGALGSPMRGLPSSTLPKEVDQLLQEVGMLSSIKSDHVVRYYGSAIKDGAICIVMEYIGGGSLTMLMGLFGTFPLATSRRYTMDILRGLKALHDQRIVHSDVGPNNVLVTRDGQCKLSDFGCSQSLHKLSSGSRTTIAGTPQYMAPEACRGETTTASDIWSLGVLTHVLVTGRLPFADADLALPPDQFVRRLAAIRPTRRMSASKLSNSSDESGTPLSNQPIQLDLQDSMLPSDALEFVQVCLLRDHTMRPTAEQLMLHPFVLK